MVSNKIRRKDGAILVLCAVLLIVLLGITALVVDVGRLYVAKQRAQNVADMAAIGGAWLLIEEIDPDILAVDEAKNIAKKNNETNPNWMVLDLNSQPGVKADVLPAGSLILGDGTTVTIGANQAIRVEGMVDVDYLFAGVLNPDNRGGSPRAVAIAMWRGENTVSYPFIPLCVSEDRIFGDDGWPEVGEQVTLKVTSTSASDAFLGPGNFLCLDFGSGANTYKEYLAGDNTESIPLSIDDWIFPKTGDMPNLTASYLQQRIDKDDVFINDATAWTEWLATGADDGVYAYTPRIVLVPIIEDPTDPTHGASDPLHIVGFAAFFIESSVYDKDTGVNVTGRFITATDVNGELHFGVGDLFDPSMKTLVTSVRLVK